MKLFVSSLVMLFSVIMARPAFATRGLSRNEIQRLASSGALKFQQARVILDNDAAFDSKIQALRSAQKGEVVRLVYYIYSNDRSSSVFSSELIKAAQRGVQVRLMVDYLTNYRQLDLFSYLESAGHGNIEVRLYGKPSFKVLRDLEFLTSACPTPTGLPEITQCAEHKWSLFPSQEPDFFARLLLSGLSGKDALSIKTAILAGQQLDLAKIKEASEGEEEKEANLKEFFKLLFDAKVKGDMFARIKLAVAISMYGEDLKPLLNEIYGRIPLNQMGESSAVEWEHLSDFNHQKLLLVANRFLQVGGRNIEDSYHTKPARIDGKKFVEKYIFMDTEFAGHLTSGGEDVARAFDEVWNFKPMAIGINQIYAIAPNDFAQNSEAARAAVILCSQKPNLTVADRAEFMTCLQNELKGHPNFKDRAAREAIAAKNIEEQSKTYVMKYLPQKKRQLETWKAEPFATDLLTSGDVQSLEAFYIENLHFSRAQPLNKRSRTYGSISGEETKSGKYLHELWVRGLENACAQGSKQRVILNSAYWIPPSSLMRAMAKMMDGTWDCRNVRVTLLTNSMETTDLNPINFLAKYELMAMMHIYSSRKGFFGSASEKSAQFEYFELKSSPGDDRISLHSKVSILGDDAIIGSANADVRSYYMDANNGVYLRGAKNFVQSYSQYIDRLLQDNMRTTNLTNVYSTTAANFEDFIATDRLMLDKLLRDRFHFKKDQTREAALKHSHASTSALAKVIYQNTQRMMSTMYLWPPNPENPGYDVREEQRRVEAEFNRLLQIF